MASIHLSLSTQHLFFLSITFFLFLHPHHIRYIPVHTYHIPPHFVVTVMMQRSFSRCVQRAIGGGRQWLAAPVSTSGLPAQTYCVEVHSSQSRLFHTTLPNNNDDDTGVRNNEAGMICFNCGEKGHISKQCTNPRVEIKDRVRCFNCGKVGHRSFDCPEPTKNKACYNCGSEEHIARDCPHPVTKG